MVLLLNAPPLSPFPFPLEFGGDINAFSFVTSGENWFVDFEGSGVGDDIVESEARVGTFASRGKSGLARNGLEDNGLETFGV